MGTVMAASGFEKPPLIFRGSSLYQVHLVKAETIRPFIPRELKIHETLGYTFGGFFLSNYEDSPYGAFDELMVIAGIVRNDRSSSAAAWAAKVLVSSDEARDHGRKEFGLPSQIAKFSKKINAMSHERNPRGLLNINGLEVKEMKDGRPTDSCNLGIKIDAKSYPMWTNLNKLITSPPIKMSLPGLSGLTEYNPHLFEYSCQIETRLRLVSTVKISKQFALNSSEECESSQLQSTHQRGSSDVTNHLIRILMQSKPFVALEFSSMKMIVDCPVKLS